MVTSFADTPITLCVVFAKAGIYFIYYLCRFWIKSGMTKY